MDRDQSKAPYFQALLDYVDSGVLPFHTPGHVQGNGMDLAFREFVGDNICAIDLTPMPGIDDLLQPVAAIKEAQELAALAWGADHTFFLINGSTSGNQCMMMTAVNPGDKIAVPRNSHKSMLGGLVMSGAHPIYMQPEVDEALHMDLCVTPETVARTMEEHPDLAAIYYTERVNLTRVDQELLRSVQRSTIDAWMRLLAAARPALTKTQARVLVHAAMALVVDVGRLVHYENSAYSQACVRKLMEATVFGTGG